MARLSNAAFISLNCLSLLLGFAAVSWSAYIQLQGGTVCQNALASPLLITGLFLFFVSFLGLVGSCCRSNIVLLIYSFAMLLLIVGLIAFTLFVLVVTNKFVGQKASPNRLQDHSLWLQNHFANGKNWDEIKSCLIDANVCDNLDNVDIKDWSLIKSGCCKPPIYCGLEPKNATFWVIPARGSAVPESDCTTWSNHQKTLCYDCNSCKGGVLAKIRKEWRLLAVLNIGVTVVVIIMFSIGCYVRNNNRYDKYYVTYSSYS